MLKKCMATKLDTNEVTEMPERKIANMTGMPGHHIRSPYDMSMRVEQMKTDHRFAGMTEAEMREFLREEQKEGMHPSLKGKHF